MNLQTNIDDVHAEIMRLENEKVFNQKAWAKVLAQLSNSPSRRQDAVRRMMTAKQNATAFLEQPHWVAGMDPGSEQDQTMYALMRKNGKTDLLIGMMAAGEDVAMETPFNADGKLKAYWVQRVDDDWGMWIHAETVGKAKSIYHKQDPSLEPADFTDIRATRPTRGSDLLDCTPFTDYTLRLAGYFYENEDFTNPFLDFCPCSMCRFEKTKPEYQAGYQKAEA